MPVEFWTGSASWAWLVVLAVGVGACSGGPATDGEGVLVFAAASLRDVLTELGEIYVASTGPATPVFNFAGSNVLAQQLLAAPRADLYISANEAWTDRLDEEGLLVDGSRTALLSNRLAVVARHDSPFELERIAELAALEFRFLALADPRGVPAGRYARGFLEGIPSARGTLHLSPSGGTLHLSPSGGTLWDAVEDRVAPAADVRAALALVEAEPAAIGIVYATDARSSDRIRVLYEVADGLSPEIRYSAAILKEAPRPRAAQHFLDFLTGPVAGEVFERHGFLPRLPTRPDSEE
ncbi:MAG: molybdate ABC transporter substrate-binding protein [bacterium]|nr:molybdate ABC transporter substrate-binding protein [bacterium]